MSRFLADALLTNREHGQDLKQTKKEKNNKQLETRTEKENKSLLLKSQTGQGFFYFAEINSFYQAQRKKKKEKHFVK